MPAAPDSIHINSAACQAVAQELQLQKQQLTEHYLAHRQPLVFFRQYGAALEYALGVLWQEWFHGHDMCLLAIGGFGRGEMYPYSDLDLAIALPLPPDEAQQARIAAFIQVLWDMALMPAVKVGSVEELCQSAHDDLTGDTAFLEARFLCGSHRLADRLLHRLNLQRDVAAFIEGKL